MIGNRVCVSTHGQELNDLYIPAPQSLIATRHTPWRLLPRAERILLIKGTMILLAAKRIKKKKPARKRKSRTAR